MNPIQYWLAVIVPPRVPIDRTNISIRVIPSAPTGGREKSLNSDSAGAGSLRAFPTRGGACTAHISTLVLGRMRCKHLHYYFDRHISIFILSSACYVVT